MQWIILAPTYKLWTRRCNSDSPCQKGRQTNISRQAAFLEFPAAAARAGIVPAYVLVSVDRRPGPPQHVAQIDVLAFLTPRVLRPKAIPCRQFLDGVAEEGVFPIRVLKQRGRIIDCELKVLLEVSELKPTVADQAAFERLLNEGLEFDEAKPGDGALPTIPDKTFVLWLELRISCS